MNSGNRFLCALAGCILALLLGGCPIPEGGSPIAAFSASPLTGTAPLSVQFTDTSMLPASTSATYQWDFGDGGESTANSPSHTYEIAGEYTLTLTVTANGNQDTEQKAGYITVVPTDSTDDTPIAFADPNLDAAIREAMAITDGSITQGQAGAVMSLEIMDVALASLAGLEYFTALDVLRISGGYDGQTALDLTPLSGLTSLTELYLDGDGIVDVAPLATLTNLTTLHLYSNFIDDLRPLASLTNLSVLFLYDNDLADLTPLSSLTRLTELNLFGNQIQDSTPLADLTQLEVLYLDSNQVTDISPLTSLGALRTLYLGMNTISDVTPLANLTNLRVLGLNDNQITDLTPLTGFPNLTLLYLAGNPLTAETMCPTIQTLTSAGTTIYHDLECGATR